MRNWMLAAGAAALAITAPALAQRGGHGGGKEKNAQVERGGGQQKAGHSGGDHGSAHMRLSQGDNRVRGQSGGHRHEMKAQARVERPVRMRSEGDKRHAQFQERATRGHRNDQLRVVNAQGRDNARVLKDETVRGQQHARFAEGEKVFKVRDFDRGVVRVRDVDRDDLFMRRVGWVDGCPPGLAKKHNGCLPPGQAAKFIGQPLANVSRIAALEPLPLGLRGLYYDDDDYYYRYGGGYLYRVDRGDNLIASMVPLFGAALLGQPLQPNYVNPYYRPSYFNSFYPNSPYDCYRYGYGYVYETDCMTGLVEDVIPTYDYGYGVGQILPASYSYYNVPYAYRGYFPDSGDYYYRYAPGAIYRVDRDTALISAVAALLTGGLTVGQPLPMGYSAYNVPLAYRTSYYDTPDMWYRYDNGYIYSVDPTTQLVTAIVRAIV